MRLADILFKVMNEEEATDLIAEHFPQGRLWDEKQDEDSVIRKFLAGLSVLERIKQTEIRHVIKELNINETEDLLPEWEASVSLPDDCSQGSKTIEERREEVKFRLSKTPVVTIEEIENLITRLFPDGCSTR